MGSANLLILILTLCLCNLLRIESLALSKKQKPISTRRQSNLSKCRVLGIRGGSDSQQGIAEDDKEKTDETDGNEINEKVELATKLRLQGKECHDEGDFKKAGELFQQAADVLRESGQDNHMDEYATCRLHQALCHLKEEKFEFCSEACTSILQDDPNASSKSDLQAVSPFIRARAYHRRAKAKLALEDRTGALQDARSAAFLGDSRGVTLYGRLMREPTIQSDEQATAQESTIQDMAMFESLFQSSQSPSSPSSTSDFSPASLLMGSGGNNLAQALSSGGSHSLAQSVIQSLSKRLDDENTHLTICNYLKKTNKEQLRQLLALTGMADVIQDSQVARIVSICHGITPKAIRRVVKAAKGIIYSVKLVRRTMQVLDKYKTVLVALIILQWAKSALFRPTPIDKAVKEVTNKVVEAAVKAA